MAIRSVRGAISVQRNTRESILQAAEEMLQALIEANDIAEEKVVTVIFTSTRDLNATYPAEAARKMGWDKVGLLCVQEMDVSGSMPRCLRVLVLWETDKSQSEMRHCYLKDASHLRSDL